MSKYGALSLTINQPATVEKKRNGFMGRALKMKIHFSAMNVFDVGVLALTKKTIHVVNTYTLNRQDKQNQYKEDSDDTGKD